MEKWSKSVIVHLVYWLTEGSSSDPESAVPTTMGTWIYPGKANSVVPNRLRDEQTPPDVEVVFSDSFEVNVADCTTVHGGFALRKRTRHILVLAIDYSMRADLVVSTISTISFSVPGAVWHSDQGSLYGAEQICHALSRKDLERLLSRAGKTTDNGYAGRFVGQFKLLVDERRAYRTLGEFLWAAENWINFYNRLRPHEGLDQPSPAHYASGWACRLLFIYPFF